MPTEYHDEQEPEFRCTHCPRLLHADELTRWVCRVCEDRALKHITELAHWYPRLSGKLTPSSAGGNNAGHVTGATRSAPLPVTLGALDLIGPGGVVTQLRTVEDDWRKTLGWTVTPFRGDDRQNMAALVPFLRNNLPWACGMYQDVTDDLKTLRILHGRVDSVVNGRKEPEVPLGCCPVANPEGVACGERLRVSPFANIIRCGGCGTNWGRDEWLRLGATMRGLSFESVA